jgi:hypothetical protein
MSPTILREAGYELRIYFNDHPPAHVHVLKGESEVRIGLDPVEIKTNWGFNNRQLRAILEIVRQHRDELLEQWDKYHPIR